MFEEAKKENPDFIIGLEKICDYGDFGRDTFYDLIEKGMPFTKIGKKFAVDKKILNEFVRSLIIKSSSLKSSEMPKE